MTDFDHSVIEREKSRSELKEPPMYRVLLMNDHYTTMDFVVKVIRKVFHKGTGEATKIMLDVHKKGKGVVGIYSRDIAATKQRQVHHLAREEGYPLKCEIEPEG
jgi:ATP-dependent Clp protease adaptor protein ClpS